MIFVLLSKFFEAFAANGVRSMSQFQVNFVTIYKFLDQYEDYLLVFRSFSLAVFVTYLHNALNFSQESSTTYFHIFNFFGQFCPILGAAIADNYFGNVRTIFYFFILYAFGWCAMDGILTFPILLAPGAIT